jgi:hypothetical protein
MEISFLFAGKFRFYDCKDMGKGCADGDSFFISSCGVGTECLPVLPYLIL